MTINFPDPYQNFASDGAEFGQPGQLVGGDTHAIQSFILDSRGNANFGWPVYSTNGAGRTCTTAPIGPFLGVICTDSGWTRADVGPWAGTADVVEPYSTISVVRKGLVWVIAGSNVTAGTQAYAAPSGDSRLTGIAAGNKAVSASFYRSALIGSPVPLLVRA